MCDINAIYYYYFFLFFFNFSISQNKLTALLKHHRQYGQEPRQERRGGRKNNTKSLSQEDSERAVGFLCSFAEDHSHAVPGRTPGFQRSDVKLLPSAETKASVWRMYRDSLTRLGKSFYQL